MGKEALGYLTPGQQELIEGWLEGIPPLLEKHPRLNAVDLVVEGGVGTRIAMAHIARRLFPDALYVGTDISERLMIDDPRQSGAIYEEILSRVQATNEHPSFNMPGATIYGNCLDTELIRDIMRRTGRKVPLLVSYNALNALLDREIILWGRKDESDITTIDDIVSPSSPYIAQLHIGEDLSRLEEAVKGSDWITERFDNGLLMLRTS